MQKIKSTTLIEIIKKHFLGIPPYIFRNRKQINEKQFDEIIKCMDEHFYKKSHMDIKETLPEEQYWKEIKDTFRNRLASHRSVIVPWLNHVKTLRGSRILEIGCGTGTSTVALAEQGAVVTGIDIDKGGIVVAKECVRHFGVTADFKVLNANKVHTVFSHGEFDIIIFFASLEHMTIEERINSMKSTWKMLKPGGLWVIIETPNRLWYYDSHSARLPFFHWLPDNLALEYTQFSKREIFRIMNKNPGPDVMNKFLRAGRGMSFHEFDIAINKAEKLNVASSLFEYQRGFFRKAYFRATTPSIKRKYTAILKKIYPRIHNGFFDEYLNLIFIKD